MKVIKHNLCNWQTILVFLLYPVMYYLLLLGFHVHNIFPSGRQLHQYGGILDTLAERTESTVKIYGNKLNIAENINDFYYPLKREYTVLSVCVVYVANKLLSKMSWQLLIADALNLYALIV